MSPTMIWASTVVERVKAYDYSERSEMVFEFQGKPDFTYFILENPKRLVVDLADTRLLPKGLQQHYRSKFISNVRHATKPNSGIRFVFQLQASRLSQFRLLKPTQFKGKNNYHLVFRFNNLSVPQIKSKVRSNTIQTKRLVPRNSSPFQAVTGSSDSGISGNRFAGRSKVKVLPSSLSHVILPVLRKSSVHEGTNRHIKPVVQSANIVASKKRNNNPVNTYHESIDRYIKIARSGSHEKVPLERLRRINIIIDPGHGGKDPGAMGQHVQEKQIVLQIAHKLAETLNKQPGFHAVLTRQDDQYVGLRQRLSIARNSGADLFLAIHADAFLHRFAQGASVYAVSQRGATSEAARWLAEKENHSEMLWGANLKTKNVELRSVLIDLQQAATVTASIDVGQRVLDQLGEQTLLHHRGVEQAAFVVLKSPDIPSILVETGFLSNHKEERKLRQTNYQQRLVNAIVAGTLQYFRAHPPKSTYLAQWVQRGVAIKIKKGETLSVLSEHYRVDMETLKHVNGLSGDNIRIGQTLYIPKILPT